VLYYGIGMKRLIVSILLFAVPAVFASKAVVGVPVADLRSDPSLPEPGKSDDKQETQLLFGETVEVVKSSGDWVYVNAIEQPEFTTNNKWEGYPGCVMKSALQQNVSTQTDKDVTKHRWVPVLTSEHESVLIMTRLPIGSKVRTIGSPVRY